MKPTESAKVCAALEWARCHMTMTDDTECMRATDDDDGPGCGKCYDEVMAALRLAPGLITAQAAVVEAGVCPECYGQRRLGRALGDGSYDWEAVCPNPYHDAIEAIDALGGSDE